MNAGSSASAAKRTFDEYLEHSLVERLVSTEDRGGDLPELGEKWVLSSALQKLIRRGRGNGAVDIALRLHEVDPGYLRRRLPIIALEDIGYGDLGLCAEVLVACSSNRWWQVPRRTIQCLVQSLATSVKSRAACDAECFASAHQETATMLPSLLGVAPARLIDVAADRTQPRLWRMNALRILGGISARVGPRYQTNSNCNLAALESVAIALQLPEPLRWILAHCRRASSLAAMLPIVVEAAADPVVRFGHDFPHSLERVRGIPLCAVDMFSECGRGALREFFLSSPALRAFAAQSVRTSSPLRLFNMALFHAESSILDRYLSSPGLDQLTRLVEAEEMRSLGMVDPDHAGVLRTLIRADADRLANIRSKRLDALVAHE